MATLSTTPHALAALQARIAARLAACNMLSEVRSIVKEFVGRTEQGKEEEVLAQLLSFVESQDLLRRQRDERLPSSNMEPVLAQQMIAASDARAVELHHFNPGKLYLKAEIKTGKAFIAQLAEARARSQHREFQVHLCLNGHREVSTPVLADVEPSFQQSFAFPLSDLPECPSDWDSLVNGRGSMLHVALTMEEARGSGAREEVPGHVGYKELVAAATIDWRHVLLRHDQVFGLELQATGPDAVLSGPAGILYVVFSLVPSPVPYASPVDPADLTDALQAQQRTASENARRYYAYARGWWADFVAISPLMSGRNVKLFAQDEEGEHRSVCTFVRQLRAGRLLDSPRHAARFVALIPFERRMCVGGTRDETWHSPHAFLARGRGDVEDHATLLCSLLLGFGLAAYVCLGTTLDQGSGPPSHYAWVMTVSTDGKQDTVVWFWDALTGQRHRIRPQPPSGSKAAGAVKKVVQVAGRYHSIGCVFNHEQSLANKQGDDRVSCVNFNLSDETLWRPLEEDRIKVVQDRASSGVMFSLRAPSIDTDAAADHLESHLQQRIATFRLDMGLDTRWDPALSYLLQPALAAYEAERVTGMAGLYNEDFQASVWRSVPSGHCFKGFPTCFNHLDLEKIASSLLNRKNEAAADVVMSVGDYVRFALRVKVIAYPDNVLATWIMLAVRFCPIAGSQRH